MSRRARRRRGRERGLMPLTGAGLVRFFEEEVKGVEVSPSLVVGLSIALIAAALIAHLAAALP